jgi:hypothetical protein
MGPSGKAPELVYECTYRAQTQPPLDIGPGPFVGKGHALPGLLIEYDVYRVT